MPLDRAMMGPGVKGIIIFKEREVGRGMLDVERRQQIVAVVERGNGVTVTDLSQRFGVSEATVRRDLAQLSRQGLIERAHGGAAPRRERHTQGLPEPPLVKRAALRADEKRRIGQAAACHVADGDAVIIASGTTTAEMISHLATRQGLTVITNALSIAALLAPYPAISVIVLGGVLRHSELTTLGALTDEALRNLRADKLFVGSPAIHVGYGFSADDMGEAHSDRTLMASARETIVLADHTKFGRVATVRVAPITWVQRIITDAAVAPTDVAALQEQGVQVEVV